MILICIKCFAKWHKVKKDDKDECPMCQNKNLKSTISISEARRVATQIRSKKKDKKGANH